MNPTRPIARCAVSHWAAPLAGLLALGAAIAFAEDLPRYEFRAGDVFVYEGKLEEISLSDGAATTTVRTATLTCLEAGAQRAILLLEAEAGQNADGSASNRGLMLEIGQRGEARLLPEFAARTAGIDWALVLVPDLPSSVRLHDPWTTPADLLGRRWNCRLTGPDPARHSHLRIERRLVADDCIAAITAEMHEGTCWFNPAQQVLTRAEQRSTYPRARSRHLVELTLRGIQRRGESWLRTRRFEAERFRARLRSEDRLIGEVVSAARAPELLVGDFQRLWVEYLAELGREASPFRTMAAAQRADASRYENLHREQAELARDWMARPAASWTLQSPEGSTLNSEAVRRRRTLEFFWSFDSRDSLRMFDVLRDLAEQTAPPRLSIVCLNVDSEYTRAQQAIETCASRLVHVLAGPPVGAELPSQLPVIRLLDEKNRVLRISFGFQPALAELVEPLLEPVEKETPRP